MRRTGITATVRRRPTVAAAVLAAAVVAVAVAVSGGGSGTPASALGPTATASTRELATTLETTGVVERIEERTISYAGDRAVAEAAGTAPTAPAVTGRTAATAAPPPTTTPPTTTAPATTTTTTGPAATEPRTGQEPAATDAASCTNVPVPASCSPAAPSTTSPTTTPTTSPGATPAPPASTTPPTTTTTTVPAAADPVPPETEDPVVLTTVAAAGSEVGRNTVLYSADDEPVVALLGSVPAWRALEAGIDGGADARQLEENLTELGYGAGITVDDEYTSATASAVKRWETAMGRAEPDGVVDAGDIVFVAEPGKVLGLEAAIGDPLEAGTTILELGTRQQVVQGAVAVVESGAWKPGTEVALEWSDGTTTTGTVSDTGTEVSDGQVALVVALSDADSVRPTGAQVAVSTVDSREAEAVAVPVAAVVAGPGGAPAVRRPVAGESADRLVPVTIGIIAGGWVEIRTGLAAGDEVRLPS